MDQLPPGHPRTIGKYEILSILGKGGMGIVYKGRDPLIDRIVAIKTILQKGDDEQLLARLRMEAKSAGRLHHPNIVTIFDYGEDGETTYLAMEYVEGANLARVINSGVTLPLETKLDIVIQLCDGLAYAHELGVLHRDIKPSNVCLTKKGDPKILDFGLARFDETRLTRTGMTSGTISYMSPERIRGESGPSDDIFALGAVAYEIFTYSAAFPGESYGEVVTKILSGKYPVPASTVADVPNDLDPILARATAADRAARYASAAEFGRALRELKHSSTMQRRVSASVAGAAEEAFKTIAFRYPGANPYSAPEIDGDATEVTAERPALSDRQPKTVAARPAAPPAAPPPAVTESFSEVRFDPSAVLTHAGVDPTVLAPGRPRQHAPVAGGEADIPPTVRAAAAGHEGQHPPGVAVEEPEVAPRRTWLIVWTAVLVALVAMAPVAASISGVVGYIALSGFAAVAWFLAVREVRERSLSLGFVLAIAVVLRLTLLFQPPTLARELYRNLWDGTVTIHGGNPYTTTAEAEELENVRRTWAYTVPPEGHVARQAPYAEMLFAWWASLGGSLIFWRIVLTLADLAAVALLWDKSKPRRSFGYAIFPLVALEGVWSGELEPIAAAILFGSWFLIQRRSDGFSGIAAVVAAGFNILSVAAVPMVFGAAWRIFVFIGGAIVAAIVPIAMFRSTAAWMQPFADLTARSPLLGGLVSWLQSAAERSEAARVTNEMLALVERRIGSTIGDVTDRGLAISAAMLVVVGAITVVAQRAREAESGIANALGIATLLAMAVNPALWIVVVPFALAANREIWLALALFSPIVLLSSGGEMNWIAYGASLVIPLLLMSVVRVQRAVDQRMPAVPTAAKA